MNNIRKILNVKFIMIIFLATLFVLATSIMQAQAFGYIPAKCPCKFWSALYFAKKVAAKIDGRYFKIEECTDDGDSIEASGGENNDLNEPCRIELEAEDGDECGYEFQCGRVIIESGDDEDGDIDVNEFALAVDISELSDAEFKACRREIKHISEWIFKVPCEF